MADFNTSKIRLVATKVLLRNVMVILIAVFAHDSIATGSVSLSIINVNIGLGIIYDMSQFYPLRSGSFWTYRYPDGSIYTMTVLPGTTVINGVATKAISDTDGYTQYLTNDSNGVRVHGQLHAPTGNSIVYVPPIQIFPLSIQIFESWPYFAQQVFSNGTAQTSSGSFPYSSVFTFVGDEAVTVPLRSFNTIRFDGSITVGGSVNSYSINYARGVGIVKEVQTPYPNSGMIELVATNVKTAFDFDGDGKADVAVYRDGSWIYQPSSGLSTYQPSSFGVTPLVQFGSGTDIPVPADYDGDGKTDQAVYRDGTWTILRSFDGGTTVVGHGGPSHIPVPADYDGDGKADVAVFLDGVWSIIRSSDGGNTLVGWGGPSFTPVPGDYDGDGKADIAVYNGGVWSIVRSSDGGNTVVGWGGPAFLPVIGDYDGDGKSDIVVYHPSGVWSIVRSSDAVNTVVGWGGAAQDLPVPADYDGDGKTDIGIYRDGAWSIKRSSDAGNTLVSWGGAPQDIPLSAQ